MAGPFEDTRADDILKSLSALRPQDPAAVNPATTAAMAQSRDAVTKMLQRQLQQMDSPFAGLSDVATAAQTALATRGRTPVGATLESLDQNRISKATQIANTLSQVANREAGVGSKGATTPYQAAQLAMSQLRFLAQRGDKDAQLAENAIDNIRTSLDPEDAVGFVVDAHSALQEAQRRAGRGLTGQEAAMVVTETAKAGKYRPRQPNLQMIVNPVTGDKELFNPRTGTSGASAVAERASPRIPVDSQPIPTRAPNMPASPIQAPVAGPPLGATTNEPVIGGRMPLPPLAQNIPAVVGQQAVKSIPESGARLDAIIRARNTAKDVPNALGIQGAIIDSIGGILQQAERAIGAPGSMGTEKMKVNEVSQARDSFNLLFSKMLPTITGDSSGRYSNFDVQLAQRMSRFRSSLSSVEQSVGFLTLVRDMEIRALRRQLSLAGPGGRAIYDTFSPEIKQAMESPDVVGPDGEAPYDDIKVEGMKAYVKKKGTNQWFEVQR